MHRSRSLFFRDSLVGKEKKMKPDGIKKACGVLLALIFVVAIFMGCCASSEIKVTADALSQDVPIFVENSQPKDGVDKEKWQKLAEKREFLPK